jgi:hypothetical protein
MRRKLLLNLCLFSLATAGSTALWAQKQQAAEQCPNFGESKPQELVNTKALWDIHFGYNETANTSGDVGMAAAHYFNSEFWVSRWASDTIYRFNTAGTMLSEFTIAGITGVRSFTSDGTYLYAGINDGMIYRINPATATLAPPHITVGGSVTQVRFCTYDATLNSGAGGFWIGNFSTAIEAVDMNGTVLTTIAAATHTLTGMYGAAVDNISAGGPYLWVFDQSGTNTTQIKQLQLPAGTPTAVTRDAFADFSVANSLTSGLAGGMFVSNQLVPGELTLGGIIQGTPNNVLFGYEIGTLSGIGLEENVINNLQVYPNPSTGIFTLANTNLTNAEYTVLDLNGKVLRSGVLQGTQVNIDLTENPSGIYVLQVTSNGEKMGSTKLIKQ